MKPVKRKNVKNGTLGKLLVILPCVVMSACTTASISPEGQEGVSVFLEKRGPAFHLK